MECQEMCVCEEYHMGTVDKHIINEEMVLLTLFESPEVFLSILT